jgi:hypothetical protein
MHFRQTTFVIDRKSEFFDDTAIPRKFRVLLLWHDDDARIQGRASRMQTYAQLIEYWRCTTFGGFQSMEALPSRAL